MTPGPPRFPENFCPAWATIGRRIVDHFVRYGEGVSQRLGDRVGHFQRTPKDSAWWTARVAADGAQHPPDDPASAPSRSD